VVRVFDVSWDVRDERPLIYISQSGSWPVYRPPPCIGIGSWLIHCGYGSLLPLLWLLKEAVSGVGSAYAKGTGMRTMIADVWQRISRVVENQRNALPRIYCFQLSQNDTLLDLVVHLAGYSRPAAPMAGRRTGKPGAELIRF
jgi:hypothetical protein